MSRFWIIWAVLAMTLLGIGNAWAQVQVRKPIDSVRDYNATFGGVEGTGTIGYTVLYRDNYDGGVISGGQGEGWGRHPAVDIPCPLDTPVKAIASGMVIWAGWRTGWGNHIIIRHGMSDINGLIEPVYSIYAHLDDMLVNLNQSVDMGQHIGNSGNSGTTDYHLHFQIDRHTEMDGDEEVASHDNPYWPPMPDNVPPEDGTLARSRVNYPDNLHVVENNTINPMAFLQMNEYDPSSIPVGFVLNADYSGHPHWTTDGRSQAFRDRYDQFIADSSTALGFPSDNIPEEVQLPYGQAVHRIEEAGGMWIQDLYGPHNGLSHPHSALIQGNSSTDPVCILKEGFWDYWMHNVGWESFGKPVNDEYLVNGVWHQTFRKPDRAYTFSWVNGSVEIDSLFGPVAVMRNVYFVNSGATRTEGDGIYHSGLWATGFNDPVELIDGVLYDGFIAMISGEEIQIDPFTVNGNMTIYVDPVVSQVIDLSTLPTVPNPGQTFQVWITVTESLGVTVSRLRVVLQNMSGTVLQTIHSVDDYNLSSGFDGVYTTQYAIVGNYKIGVQYSLDNGSTWSYFDTDAQTDNPLNFSIVAAPVAPVASFTRAPISGTIPLTVQFTDQSSNNPTSWLWSFGDGSNSTSQNPSHTYNATGTFNVSLTVSNGAGSDNETWNNCVTVNSSGGVPVVNFTAGPLSGDAPLTVQFMDLSTGNPTSWEWNFTDGGSSTEQNPTHVYQYPGVYGVYLSISNAYGADAMWRFDYIQVNGEALEANFTADVVSGQVPLTVQFTDQSSGNPILWSWNFGDSVHSTEQNPSHTYNTPGIYNVSLWVEDVVLGDELIRPQYITVLDEGGCLGDGGYALDGVDQYLESSSVPYTPGIGPITIEFYAKTTQLYGTIFQATRIDDGVPDGEERQFIWVYMRDNGTIVTEVSWEENNYHHWILDAGDSFISDGEWHSFALVVENDLVATMQMYVDGVLEFTKTHPSDMYNIHDLSGAWLLGAYKLYSVPNPEAIDFFPGSIDEVRISNVARSAEEIFTNHHNREEFTVDEYTVALWHMNGPVINVAKRANAQGNSAIALSEHNGPTATYGFNECLPPAPEPVQVSITYLDQEILLDWEDVPGVISYRVYGAHNGEAYGLLAESIESQQTLAGPILNPDSVWLFYVTVIK